MSFIEDKLNRENRQLIAQREHLVAALEEAVALIDGPHSDESREAAIKRLRTHLRKAIQNARKTVAA